MNNRRTIVLVLRSGGDFSYRDVELISRHIKGHWDSEIPPRIVCLWDKATREYDLGNVEIVPLKTDLKGTWARMQLYSPEMDKYRPFLYLDLDTAVMSSVETLFDAAEKSDEFITLEDFWQKDQMATGVVWFPAKSEKVSKVWEAYKRGKEKIVGFRMDYFLRKIITPDAYWDQYVKGIYDFKPKQGKVLGTIPPMANLICFHGKPRIFDAAESSVGIQWVKDYVNCHFSVPKKNDLGVTVIIPYNRDRGWLKHAINSVPDNAQLILSQGDGNWPENFNKALDQATGKYIRWLHEDDMLTENSLMDAIKAMEEQKADFIHGNAYEINPDNKVIREYRPSIKRPSLNELLKNNVLHSGTMVYRKEVFEKVGKMDETLWTAEEFEFNLRCLRQGMKLGYCDKFLVYYRRHPAQKVRVVPAQERLKEKMQVKSLYTK